MSDLLKIFHFHLDIPIREKYSFNVVNVKNFQDVENYNLNKFSEKFVVIATQGNSDLVAITESLKIKATYIA